MTKMREREWQKSGTGNNKCNSRFPAGMTKKERTGMAKKWNKQQQVQQQIPCGNDKKRENGNGKQ
jgi:hypothetical protein